MFFSRHVCVFGGSDGHNTKTKQAAVQRQKIAQAIHEAALEGEEQRSVVHKVARALSEIIDCKSVNIRRSLMKQISKFKQQTSDASAPAAAPVAAPQSTTPKEETAPAPATEKEAPKPPQQHSGEVDEVKYPPRSPVAQSI